MRWTQVKYLTAMMLIGDGVMALLRPHRDARAWSVGPQFWKNLMRYLSDHPDTLRTIGVAEIAVGIALVAGNGTLEEQLAERADAVRASVRNLA